MTSPKAGGWNADRFRQLMRLHPAAVTVITTGRAPARTGLTATAVMSLSVEPTSIVCAVSRSAYSLARILENQTFCVNTLAADQVRLARVFSGQAGLQGEDRFAEDDWGTLETGAPVLTTAVISLDCRLMQAVDAATHTLLIGQVVAGRQHAEASALVYVDGRWTCADAQALPA